MAVRIACHGLTGGHDAVTAFRDLDLAVESGQVLALLGPNGAGKTTLMQTLAGLLRPQAGSIEVDGTSLRTGRPAAANRAGVVLVPDTRCLFTTLTVEDNLKAASRRSKRRPRELLETFPDLEKRWDLKAGALSGGEQQMLAMARALVQNPRVLLIDEMSMGLAPQIVESLFETVRHVADDQDCAVILVEQHVGLALSTADTAAVLNHGTIALADTAANLLADAERLEQAYFGAVATNGSPSS